MTVRQTNFTKQDGKVLKAKTRFTKQNGVVKQIVAGWTKRNGIVEQVYSLTRVAKPITWFASDYDYRPVIATVDSIIAVVSNAGSYLITNYWDAPEVNELPENGINGFNTQKFFNYAGGNTAKQSILYSKSNYQYVRETILATLEYFKYQVTGYISNASIKLGPQLYMMMRDNQTYWEVNTAIASQEERYWPKPLPFLSGSYGAITLSDGYGVLANVQDGACAFAAYNQGNMITGQTTLTRSGSLTPLYTPNGTDVFMGLVNYGSEGRVVRFDPTTGDIEEWTPLGDGGLFGAYNGFVFCIRSSSDTSIAFYVDKYDIQGNIVVSIPVPLSAGFTHPGTVTVDYGSATINSGRYAAVSVGYPTNYKVVFDLAQL